jgi:predicted TIM-barrel fold metal-dependent hydrolase
MKVGLCPTPILRIVRRMIAMVIDAHSHLLQGRHPVSDLPQSLDDLGDLNVAELLAGLDQLGVEAVVTLAQEMARIRDQWLGANSLAADLQERLEGRFFAIAGFEPVTRWDQFNAPRFEQVRELVRSRRVRGLLITPPYGHFQLNDRWVWTLDQVVVDFPDLRLNIEHMAWPWTEELLAIMAHGPNVHTDVTMLSMRPHLLAWHLTIAGDYGFLDRIFWGTDYVGRDNEEYLETVRQELDFYRNRLNPMLKGCGWPTLSTAQIEGLLGDNIRRFLNL